LFNAGNGGRIVMRTTSADRRVRVYLKRQLSTVAGRRERARRGGFPTKAAAVQARKALLSRSAEESTTVLWTVAKWLRYWLPTRTSIRPSTLRSYTEHVDNVLIPHLGSVRLGKLTGRQVATMFATLASTPNKWGRRPSPSTVHRIRATLRTALNAAIRDGLIRDNPARHIELPTPRRPQAQVWTDHRTREWGRTGQRFPVAVWTARLLAEFLKFVEGDRLYAMWWLIALRGLRRGEAAGLRWIDVDLDEQVIMICQQRITFGHTTTVGPRRPPPAAAPSRWTRSPYGCYSCIASCRCRRRPSRATGGSRPATCSQTPSGSRSTPTT
jgi:Phage integrase, N-terminal SAM-like domain